MLFSQAKTVTSRPTVSTILVVLFAATVFLTAPHALITRLVGSRVLPTAEASGDRPAKLHAIANAYGRLPLSFARNLGQDDGRVRFKARGLDCDLFLTADEAVLALRYGAGVVREGTESAPEGRSHSADAFRVLRMKFRGANRNAKIEGLGEMPGKVNYFIGNDPRKWRK